MTIYFIVVVCLLLQIVIPFMAERNRPYNTKGMVKAEYSEELKGLIVRLLNEEDL